MKNLTKEQKISLLQLEKSILLQKVSIIEKEIQRIKIQLILLSRNSEDESPKNLAKKEEVRNLKLDFDFFYEHFYEIQELFFEELKYLDLQSDKSKILQEELLYFQNTSLIRPEVLISNFNNLWNKISNL